MYNPHAKLNRWNLDNFDWSLIQSFLAVAETGSFSAAGRDLGISQPTVGRQIQQLEKQLGTPLFQRENKGHSLTSAGVDLIEHARDMKTSAARMSLLAAGQAETLSGVVRVTASVIVSHYILPPIFARIRLAEPAIELELNPSDATENLLFREADIAVRMYRPEQLDVITRKVGAQRFGLFATKTYLDQRGRPQNFEDIINHDMIGFDRSDLMVKGMKELGMNIDRSFFKVRCDNQTVYWELVTAGCGIGVAPLNIASNTPGMERILPDIAIPDLPIWLTAPEALRTSPRIRRVYDLLAEGLATVAGG
ncbi:MAG: DNA-binding transcriptional LysR family regulator [Paracoccaceae bacterium]